MTIRASYRTKVAEEYQVILDLTATAKPPGHDNFREELRTPYQLWTDLDALRKPSKGVVAYTAPGNRSGRCEILQVAYREVKFKEADQPSTIAIVHFRKAPYKT